MKAPPLPDKPCRVLMAEIVDDYSDLSLQSLRYEVAFDPACMSPGGYHYNFGKGEGRARGWQPLSRQFGDFGFYVVDVLDPV
jgi:hypothetical protein